MLRSLLDAPIFDQDRADAEEGHRLAEKLGLMRRTFEPKVIIETTPTRTGDDFMNRFTAQGK